MKQRTTGEELPVSAVLLAGGRGTRFWPRSRARTPKQLLNIFGRETMLCQTTARLKSLVAPRNIWAVTNRDQAAAVRRELRGVPASHVLAEPMGRNTAAAIGLAAIHLAHEHGDALMAVLPSDAYIRDLARYRTLVRAALDQARAPGSLVVLGIPPTRPETGYGYIERGAASGRERGVAVYVVECFTEKPALAQAREYLASGTYFWNAGMFFWRASTFLESLERFLPATRGALGELGKTIGTPRYASVLRRIYPRLENVSVDYAVMEPATRLRVRTDSSSGRGVLARGTRGGASAPRVFVIPAQIGWSDIGSWAAVYELLAKRPAENVSAGPYFALDSVGNYFWSPKKLIAAIGVRDLVLVETKDAILICSRDRSQDVGKIVKWLQERNESDLL